MNSNLSKVSVIVPMYNSECFIKRCLESILAQTYGDLEVIVVDDCSSDCSRKIVFNLIMSDDRIQLVEMGVRAGAAAARNAGIAAACGRYIAFCDSDDLWFEEKIAKQILAMEANKAAISHSSVYYVGSKSRRLMLAKPIVTRDDMKVRNWIANSSGVIDRRLVAHIRQLPCRHEDYEMWCHALSCENFSIGLYEPLVEINRRSDSLSGNKVRSLIWHFKAQRLIFSFSNREIILRFIQFLKI